MCRGCFPPGCSPGGCVGLSPGSVSAVELCVCLPACTVRWAASWAKAWSRRGPRGVLGDPHSLSFLALSFSAIFHWC